MKLVKLNELVIKTHYLLFSKDTLLYIYGITKANNYFVISDPLFDDKSELTFLKEGEFEAIDSCNGTSR